MHIILATIALLLTVGYGSSCVRSTSTTSAQTTPAEATKDDAARAAQALAVSKGSGRGRRSAVCEVLRGYPKGEGEQLSFEAGELSQLCRPFIKQQSRDELDRCGDVSRDPYVSYFTWASRNEMTKKGKGNLYADLDLQPQLESLNKRVEELRVEASRLCCGSDDACQTAMMGVEVDICKPNEDPDAPDSCVFGGSYRMPGRGYTQIFRAIYRQYAGEEAADLKNLAEKNLSLTDLDPVAPAGVSGGSITLSSYVSKRTGAAGLEPVILHEFGHACSMIKMQQGSLGGQSPESLPRAHRAVEWLDRARQRCKVDLELPEAYYDFWESIGESRGLATCLFDLTVANQKQAVDRPCPNLCPGHYLEESVGIAFSLLLGNLSDGPSSVFPRTCDHVRDGQHPLVSDVMECMAQHSPRFRERLRRAHACQ